RRLRTGVLPSCDDPICACSQCSVTMMISSKDTKDTIAFLITTVYHTQIRNWIVPYLRIERVRHVIEKTDTIDAAPKQEPSVTARVPAQSVPAPASAVSAQLRTLVWILVIGGIAPALDTTIVNVALPTLGHALNTTVSTSQWTITGYLLALAIALPASGWLTDHSGGKKLWLSTLTLFVLGSALAGLSWNIDSLIVFRIFQGAAAGILTPLLIILLLRMAKGTSLGSLMAIATLPAVIVPVLGPVVGGLIIGSLDWRWIFYVNVPICIIGALLAWWKLPADEPLQNRDSFDIPGLIDRKSVV